MAITYSRATNRTARLQNDISQEIDDVMKKNDITQRQAALMCGVTDQTIRNAIKDPESVRPQTLERILLKLTEPKQ